MGLCGIKSMQSTCVAQFCDIMFALSQGESSNGRLVPLIEIEIADDYLMREAEHRHRH
jgi:hypothetical protein